MYDFPSICPSVCQLQRPVLVCTKNTFYDFHLSVRLSVSYKIQCKCNWQTDQRKIIEWEIADRLTLILYYICILCVCFFQKTRILGFGWFEWTLGVVPTVALVTWTVLDLLVHLLNPNLALDPCRELNLELNFTFHLERVTPWPELVNITNFNW